MHAPLLLLAVTLLLGIQAKPEGYYHAESSFHRSSSSYKNNELQHQNQDEGFYSENGDLERKTKPKVNSYTQHSEYVNPKLRTGEYNSNQGIDSGFDSQYAGSNQYASGSGYRSGGRASTYGVAANLEELSQRLEADLSRQLHSAISEQYAQSSSYSHNSMQQDVRRFEEELRVNLTRKLQEALYEQYGQQSVRGPYSYSITRGGAASNTANYNVQDLENLKRQVENNLVDQLQEEVRTRYEASESRSSYSSNNNRPVALRSDSQVAGVKTAHRPSGFRYPQPTDSSSYYTPRYSDSSYTGTSNVNYASSSSATYRLTDVVTEVQRDLSRIIDEILDEEQRKNTELIRSGVRPNYDESFQYLRQLLIRNITDRIDEKINRYYGTQVERGDYYYSLTPSGSTKTQPNYSSEDLENLKQQVEDNLVEKLSYGIRQQESRYDEERRYIETQQTGYRNSHSSAASFSSANQHGIVPLSSQASTRPVSQHGVIPLSSHSSTGQYDYVNTHRQTGYDINPDSEVELTNIQQQLQNDLSRQLQYAIRDQTKEYSTYASSGSVGSSSYQTALQQLTEELKRNLTEQLQRSLAQHRGSSYSYGSARSSSNYNQEQLDDITRRLQDNLIRQLQDGFRQSWSSQYSYSASSSSSSGGSSSAGYNRPAYGVKTRGRAQGYTQYGAEDCDETGYGGHQTYRRKREIVLRNRGGQYDDGLTQQTEDGFGYYQQQQQGLTQQQEDVFDYFRNPDQDDYYYRQQLQKQQAANLEGLTQQQADLEDLTQQQQQEEDYYNQQQQNQNEETETFSLGSKPGFGAVNQQKPSEKLQNSAELDDLTQQQQTEDIYGSLQIGARRTTTEANSEFDDLAQQQQTDHTYGNLQVGSQYRQKRTTTEASYSQFDDLTQQQQTEDIYGNLQIGSRRTTTKPTNLQLQETEDVYENLAPASKTTEKPLNFQVEDLTQQQQQQNTEELYDDYQAPSRRPTLKPLSFQLGDLTQQQQTEDAYGTFPTSSRRTTVKPYYYQQSDLEDLTQQQQTEDIYGNLQIGSRTTTRPYSYHQSSPNPQSDDLTQQQETEDIYGNLQTGSRTTTRPYSYYRPSVNRQTDDLTQQQQTEDVYLGNLEIGSRRTTEIPQVQQNNQQQVQDNFEWIAQGAADENLQSRRSQYNYRNQRISSTTQKYSQEDEEPQGVIPLSSTNQQQLETGSQTKPNQFEDQAGLTQQSEDGFGTFAFGSQQKPSLYDQSDLTQQLEDGFGSFRGEDNSRELSQQSLSQTKPQDQQQQVDTDLTQQTVDEPIGRQDGSPSYYPPGYEGPKNTGSYRSGQQISPLSQYTVQQAEQQTIENSEEVQDLVQKPIEKQSAYQLQDVGPQAEVRELPEEQRSAESLQEEIQTEEPQPQPGFWKKVGNKFSSAYISVKDKAKQVFG